MVASRSVSLLVDLKAQLLASWARVVSSALNCRFVPPWAAPGRDSTLAGVDLLIRLGLAIAILQVLRARIERQELIQLGRSALRRGCSAPWPRSRAR